MKNFIDRLDDFDHLIISIKRTANPSATYVREFDWDGNQKVVAIGYFAPPAAIFHRLVMRRLASQILAILRELPRRPSLINAHKLTIEGVLAYLLWKRLTVPYVCWVRGEVETKFFRFKPELRGLFREVIRNAEALYFVSAWFKPWIEARYPGVARQVGLMPNFAPPAAPRTSGDWRSDALVTVMDLNVYEKKGFPWLIGGLKGARTRFPDLTLDVIGWSSPEVMRVVQGMVDTEGLTAAVRFLGEMTHDEVLRTLPRYAAFVLPSRNETFGMAYVEALMAGVPILYSKGTGIDGYLDDLDVGIGVPVGDVVAVAHGLTRLAAEAPRFRAAIERDYPVIRNRFSADPYVEDYRQLVARVTEERGMANRSAPNRSA